MPNYTWRCDCCGATFEQVVPIADRDKIYECECMWGAELRRVFEAPNVMNHALPDGTKRFSDLKQKIKLQQAKKWNNDKADKARLDRELSKFKSSKESA